MHVSRTYTALSGSLSETSSLVSTGTLPLLYAGAMLIDAVSSLVFGLLFDKKGSLALVLSTLISAPFAFLVFSLHTVPALLLGIALWGVGMGAQESILKAAVSTMIPKASRATGYGFFEFFFGVFFFLGKLAPGQSLRSEPHCHGRPFRPGPARGHPFFLGFRAKIARVSTGSLKLALVSLPLEISA
ncbi:MAG: hypothetical protein MSC43_07155 [Clostridiales bacterium]|nr:hypothetical protein [Clostridiales bacterium]